MSSTTDINTIKNPIETSGIGLMSGEECSLVIKPSSQKGIKFFCNGNNTPLFADVNTVVSTQNCVTIANQAGQVSLIEHFMATCGYFGIDSLDIDIKGIELPIFDGSAKTWIELFKKAGIDANPSSIDIKEPIFYQKNNVTISILPSEKLDITYLLDFSDHPDLKQRWINLNADNIKEAIEARTFGYVKDLEKIQALGLAKGVNIDNTLGLTDDGYTTPIRSEYEPIKHKVLDLMGDFKLANINLPKFNAQIIAKQAGHASHYEMAKILKNILKG